MGHFLPVRQWSRWRSRAAVAQACIDAPALLGLPEPDAQAEKIQQTHCREPSIGRHALVTALASGSLRPLSVDAQLFLKDLKDVGLRRGPFFRLVFDRVPHEPLFRVQSVLL